ncbi:SNF2 domain protein [Quillaja saponaria]|uniref:SNF2 domain protein n=1 Tax=Quillaja saponaria TaxID=32244 RepID=A0AAD7PSM3_QUISA|nr:SNF2 domain protein [Quillaja saponaria]
MNQAPLEPIQKAANPYHILLKESIDRFLSEYRNGVTDFCHFRLIFSRLLQNLPDPPLEIVWFYSATIFHSNKLSIDQDPLSGVSIAKDLFQLLVSCSDSCGSLTRIGILAPVVYELYCLVVEKKYLNMVESLLEGLISYCSICCGQEELHENTDELVGLEWGLMDVIPVWMVDKSGSVDYLKDFFPIITDQFRKMIKMGCGIGLLAGVVMCEAFLLRLCLKFESGTSQAELEKYLPSLVVQMMTGFRNRSFFDNIFRMLLEPVFPVTSILSSENVVVLKEILYDAVMLVEYPFLNSQTQLLLPGRLLKELAVSWLFVADIAIQYVRDKGYQEKTISYLKAFCESCIPLQLINWVTNQPSIGGKISIQNVSTPVALIKWLLLSEVQGVTVFNNDTAKLRAKSLICKSEVDPVLPVIKHFHNNLGNNLFSDAAGGGREEYKFDDDIEMVDSINNRFLAADGRMDSSTDGTRKRKEWVKDESKIQFKFVKYQCYENSAK